MLFVISTVVGGSAESHTYGLPLIFPRSIIARVAMIPRMAQGRALPLLRLSSVSISILLGVTSLVAAVLEQ